MNNRYFPSILRLGTGTSPEHWSVSMEYIIEVFNRDNLVETSKKEPIICYRSGNGACGPSGLFFVNVSDKSCYAYSTFYEKSDFQLIKK